MARDKAGYRPALSSYALSGWVWGYAVTGTRVRGKWALEVLLIRAQDLPRLDGSAPPPATGTATLSLRAQACPRQLERVSVRRDCCKLMCGDD
eukprot:2165316-Rhodomonas_salina.2